MLKLIAGIWCEVPSLIEPCPPCSGRVGVPIGACPWCNAPIIAMGDKTFQNLHTRACTAGALAACARSSEQAREALGWKL